LIEAVFEETQREKQTRRNNNNNNTWSDVIEGAQAGGRSAAGRGLGAHPVEPTKRENSAAQRSAAQRVKKVVVTGIQTRWWATSITTEQMVTNDEL
jgi:hypothetical protein